MRHTFSLTGEPVPSQRPRWRLMGKICQLYTAPRHRKRLDDIATQLKNSIRATKIALPDDSLSFALVVTTHPGTRKDGKPRQLKGDQDNYVKLVADACQGILYANDKAGCLMAGFKGDSVPGMGKQVVDILWFGKQEDPIPALSDALLALLTTLEYRDR